MKYKLVLILVFYKVARFASADFIHPIDNCPIGYRLATLQEAESNDSSYHQLGEWTIPKPTHTLSMDDLSDKDNSTASNNKALKHSCTALQDETRPPIDHMLEAYEQEAITEASDERALMGQEGEPIVQLVTKNTLTDNVLFRGNLPISHSTEKFQYDNLVTRLEQAAATAGATLPENYTIIDISLINELTPEEAKNLSTEKEFWRAHPTLGYLINHPIYGAFTSPNTYPKATRKSLERYSLDHLNKLITEIHEKLISQNEHPLLLYVHCEDGKDRTGEVIAAYSMRYLEVSYKDALNNANDIAGRKIRRFSKHGIQWYAYYLRDVLDIPTIGPITD